MSSSTLIGGKFIKKNPLQDQLSSLNAVISTNESTQFVIGHVIYNLQIPTKNHQQLRLFNSKFKFRHIIYLFLSVQCTVDLEQLLTHLRCFECGEKRGKSFWVQGQTTTTTIHFSQPVEIILMSRLHSGVKSNFVFFFCIKHGFLSILMTFDDTVLCQSAF